jgi:hypothetical protein
MGDIKGDDAGLPKPILDSLIQSLSLAQGGVFLALRRLAEEENRSEDSTTVAKAAQIDAAVVKVKESASELQREAGNFLRAVDKVVVALDRLKRTYPPKRRRISR